MRANGLCMCSGYPFYKFKTIFKAIAPTCC